MKISPIINFNIYKSRIPSFSKNETKENTKGSVVTNPLELPNYKYYVIPSKDERIYTSENKELGEVPSEFKINDFDNVPCPACGKKMLPREKFYEFLQELDKNTPDKYLETLHKYSKYMRPVEYSVLEEMQEISDQSGEKDIRKLLERLRDTKLPILEKVQLQKIKQMTTLARTLPEDERKVLMHRIRELKGMIRKKNTESPFRRKILIERISKVKIKNQYKYNKLQNIANSFPRSFDTNSAWIVKYSGKDKTGQNWSSKDIAKRMLYYSVPNTDHILARGIELNHDDISNYMSMHTSCNGQKSDKSFLQWFYEDPKKRMTSLKAYFKKANELISSEKITDTKYKNYVANATQNIYDITQGKVDLREIK